MRLLRKIKFKLTPWLIKLCLILRSPWLTAQILLFNLKSINSNASYKVLVLRRSIFIDDVQAMAEYSSRICYQVIDRELFKLILFYFLHKDELLKLTEYNYHSTKTGHTGKLKYYNYKKKLLPLLQKKLKFQAILAGSIGYLEQQEIARVCLTINLPLIVLHKEGLTAGVYKDSADLYKDYTFIGTKVLVYNEKVIPALAKTQGLSPEMMEVVGVPRLDKYLSKHQIASQSHQIVLFSFYPKFRFSRLISDPIILKHAQQRCIEFHTWVMSFAVQHPDYSVIIKTKVADYYLQDVQDNLDKNYPQGIPNLIITNKLNSVDLILSSQVVLGFSSMALIEAILAGRLIVSAYFGDLIPDKTWDYFEECPELVNYAKTFSELEDYILNSKKYLEIDPVKRDRYLEKFIYIPDGRASQRAETAIIKTIESDRSA